MKNFERRIKKIENWEAKLPPFDKVIIVHEPSFPCKSLDSHKCPEYIKAQQSSSGVALCIPECGDCAERRVEG